MVKRSDGLAEALSEMPPEPAAQDKARTEKSKKSVYVYIAALFLVVVLFTLLSYFMQQRNNSEISSLNEKNASAQLNIENLQSTNLQLKSESDTDKKQISDLQSQVDDLEKQIEDIKQQWQNDVQSVKDADQAAYNDLQAKYNELVEKSGSKGKTHG
ncbi:hypothetical protein SAMN02745823_01040 [Sporobacter termitidis DSM 10068]|uniref:Uncharacterized protein n=1 Tax=Sporobacter termitidis DSM 10068 TaxID=1123282 RepID=A0A1M5VUU7_9FIRM|nr:hypothetical protein [Sporobacter termitidis]SHH79001.1 hypothetical protein SAMN02745823_01040 [Sporobacter termitidis DSM 10068]